MGNSVYMMLYFFVIYAFLGWCGEVCFAAVTRGEIVNRGFLNGPVCPIYGVGMVGVLLLLEPVSDKLVPLFFLGTLICSAIELVGGWILKKVFDTRWWDYSDRPFNLGGYVCLEFSIIWGFAVVFVVRLVHPVIAGFVAMIPRVLGIVALCICMALFVADFVITLITIIGLKKKLGELERIAQALHAISDPLSQRVGSSALAADARLDEVKQTGQEKVREGKERLAEVREHSQERMAEGRERLAESKERMEAVIAAQQERMEAAIAASQERKAETRKKLEQLEHRQKELLHAIRNGKGFGTRRIAGAFPALRESLREKLDHFERK